MRLMAWYYNQQFRCHHYVSAVKVPAEGIEVLQTCVTESAKVIQKIIAMIAMQLPSRESHQLLAPCHTLFTLVVHIDDR